MSREIPQAVRAVAGLAATVLDEARRLPQTLPGLPVRVIGLAMQATMKLQQGYAGLVARGDEVFTGIRGEAEPGMATFDEDLPEAPTAGRTSAFDRASAPVADEEVAEEVAALIDDEVSGLPPEPAPEEVVEALADISDEVAAAGLDLDRAEPGLTTEDALETALLEADGAPDSALVDGGTADTGLVDTDEIAESPTTPVLEVPDAEAPSGEAPVHETAASEALVGEAPVTEADAAEAAAPSDPGGSPVGEAAGAPDVTGEVDVLTPDGGVTTVEGTITDEGVAAPETAPEAAPEAPGDQTAGAPAQADRQDTGVDEAAGSGVSDADTRPSTGETPAADDRDATGSGDEVVTAAGAQVDDAVGAGEPTPTGTATEETPAATTDEAATDQAPADEAVATDEGGTDVAAATGVRTDVDESATPEEAEDTTGAEAAGAAPVEGYDSFTVAQLRGRLRGYQLSTVADLVAYEEATRAREPYLRMLRNRLEKLERLAVEESPLAPRGA